MHWWTFLTSTRLHSTSLEPLEISRPFGTVCQIKELHRCAARHSVVSIIAGKGTVAIFCPFLNRRGLVWQMFWRNWYLRITRSLARWDEVSRCTCKDAKNMAMYIYIIHVYTVYVYRDICIIHDKQRYMHPTHTWKLEVNYSYAHTQCVSESLQILST